MTTTKPVILGVLALQGAFREHIAYFKHLIDSNPTEYSAYDFKIIEVKLNKI